jgi:hypothetical protein
MNNSLSSQPSCLPAATSWRQFALRRREGDEMTGHVVAAGSGTLRVELAPGVVGTLAYRHCFAGPLERRDFVLAHGPGAPLRVRIRRLSAADERCELRLADAVALRWLHPARSR